MLRGFVVGAALATSTSCVVIDPNAQLCAVGGEGCACTQGGACDTGLECREGMCVDPDAPVGTGTSGASQGETDDVDTSGATSNDTEDTGLEHGPNVVFVTSTQHRPSALGGLEGADAICQMRADAAGLDGTYRAWLSTSDTDAKNRLAGARGWVRPDGSPFARDLAQIVAGGFYYPPMLDEHGAVPSTWRVWTGTLGDGTALAFEGHFCQDWTDDDPGTSALQGELDAGPGWWSDRFIVPCDDAARLYCFGIDHDYDLEIEPVQGRQVFVTNAGLDADEGRDVADTLCAAEAAAAGLSGSFLALMAVPGSAPADRFDLGGPPWVRMDGIPLFAPGDAMGSLETAIALRANGTVASVAMAWLGSTSPTAAGTLDHTCQDWSSLMGSAPLATVFHTFWYNWGLGGGTDECDARFPVICFEE
jgi:hypothetical protein